MFELLNIATVQQKHAAEQKKMIAQNVANADRPDYRAKHIEDLDFKKHLKASSPTGLSTTNARHIQTSKPTIQAFKTHEDRHSVDVTRSGNTVEIDKEMFMSADISARSKMARSFMKSFMGFLKISMRS